MAQQLAVRQMTKMQQAKARFLLQNVFFSALLMGTPIEAKPGIGTAATDMKKIMYDPEFIESLDMDVTIFVLAHELLHIVLKHGLRRFGRDPHRWNIACDYAINIKLHKAGIKLWSECYFDRKYDGMSAEQIYDALPKDEGGPGEGEPGGGIGDDLVDPGAMDEDERSEIERKINQRVAQAATQARMAGKFGADLEALVDGILNPELPWPHLLAAYMNQFTSEDESWSRRNRRFSTFLPARHSLRMGELVCAVDTSGSIHQSVFDRIAAELNYIKTSVKPTLIRVVYCDAEVSREQTFEPHEELELKPKGGGGTDMRVVLKHVEQYEPMVVVLITDGYTPWGDEPSYPLLVLMTTDQVSPVGTTIHVTA